MNWTLFVAAVGLWISCGPSKKESVEKVEEITTGPRIVGEQIDYQLDTLTMKGYLAYDANREGSRPGIIVVHEWWGHNELNWGIPHWQLTCMVEAETPAIPRMHKNL